MKREYTDAERLDFLEREANTDPILLHNVAPGQSIKGNFRGLGLKNTGRSLRQALDDMMRFDSTYGDVDE